jgi:hypothetical protein
MEEEEESSTVRKCLRHIDNNSSNSPEEELEEEEETMGKEEEETVEEVSSEVSSMKLNTFEEKMYARRTRGILFKDDATPTRSHRSHAHRKVVGTPMRRAATRTMTTMISRCR